MMHVCFRGRKVRKTESAVFYIFVKFFKASLAIWRQWKTSEEKPTGTVGP